MAIDKIEFKKFEMTIMQTAKDDPRPYLFLTKQHIFPISIKKPTTLTNS